MQWHQAHNPYRASYSNQVGVSGTPPVNLDGVPFDDIQDWDPSSPTLGQFFFMVGFSKVGGPDIIK